MVDQQTTFDQAGTTRRPKRGPLSDDADHNQPFPDLSTYTIDQLEQYLTVLEGSNQELEGVRVVAQLNAYRSDESRDTRRRWAKMSLTANAQMRADDPCDRARQGRQNFALRTWIIEHLGPGEDPDWNPEALAADTLAVLPVDANQAATLSAKWRDLPIKQISELRRHKNLTAHVDRLVGYLQEGPTKDRLIAWLGVRAQLP